MLRPSETRAMMTFLLTLFVMYWLPTIVAMVRHTPSALGIAALNFFLGWTVIGWLLALVWALAAHPQQVIIIENGRVVRS
jgi:Na+/H+-dicarboxylate symporter